MGAIFSKCGKHRLFLQRGPLDSPMLLWVMLNPSTADGVTNDPTINSVLRISRNLGYENIAVVNLYSVIATDPQELLALLKRSHRTGDVLHPKAGIWFDVHAIEAHKIVVAWGAHAPMDRAREVTKFLQHLRSDSVYHPLYCLGTNKNGSPKHPLYLRANSPLIPWEMP